MTKDAGFKRRVRARTARTGEAYTTARAQLDRAPGTPLHVTNGDSAARTLADAVEGQVVAWRDELHEGPVPAGLTAAALRRVRAEHLAGSGRQPVEDILADLEARDRALDRHAGGAYVLWFEADLYDQLQLIQILHRLDQLGVAPGSVTLVSIGEYPRFGHFGGLGELSAEQLLRLLPDGVHLRSETFRLASEAWAGFTAPEPTALPKLARAISPELRFLGEAIGRFVQEYPSRSDGLSLSERRILVTLAEGAGTLREAWRRLWERERRPYLADLPFLRMVRGLAGGPRPLLTVDGEAVRLTESGADVLAGLADHAALNAIDRWLGGVHLTGREPAWRYDERIETIVPA